jgi:hypothetical protein
VYGGVHRGYRGVDGFPGGLAEQFAAAQLGEAFASGLQFLGIEDDWEEFAVIGQGNQHACFRVDVAGVAEDGEAEAFADLLFWLGIDLWIVEHNQGGTAFGRCGAVTYKVLALSWHWSAWCAWKF